MIAEIEAAEAALAPECRHMIAYHVNHTPGQGVGPILKPDALSVINFHYLPWLEKSRVEAWEFRIGGGAESGNRKEQLGRLKRFMEGLLFVRMRRDSGVVAGGWMAGGVSGAPSASRGSGMPSTFITAVTRRESGGIGSVKRRPR